MVVVVRNAIADELGEKPPAENTPSISPEPPQPTHQQINNIPTSQHSITDVLEECLAAKERTKKAVETIRTETRIFKEWTGISNIGGVTIGLVKDYVDNCLRKMPKDANKKTALKMCKTVREQITCGANLGLPLIATTTINNRLTNLGVVFSFAAQHGYCPPRLTRSSLEALSSNPRSRSLRHQSATPRSASPLALYSPPG